MKSSLTAPDIVLALELYQLRERIRADRARESELTSYFRSNLPVGTINLGQFELSVDESTRSSLDKKALEQALGLDALRKYEKQTLVKSLKIRKVA